MFRKISQLTRVSIVALGAAILLSSSIPLSLPRLVVPLYAQQTMTQTTLSAAVSISTDRFTVASATGISAGYILFVDKEAMVVNSISSTTVVVRRGTNGTAAAIHNSGAPVIVGPANYFSAYEPAGRCVATSEVALPRVVLPTASVFDCKNSVWVRYREQGLPSFTTGAPTTYTSAGAITVQQGLQLIGSAGALAMTLAAPTALQEGMEMQLYASTAQAHTITFTGGFNGGTTARDVCTLGGAIGDGITIRAYNLIWYVTANRNCTLA